MDLMSTTQVLGNVGEFVGAIAVAVTLVYLVVEVHRNTEALRLATSESILRGIIDANRIQIESPEVNDIILRASEDRSSLDRAERSRFNGHANILIYGWQRSYYCHEANALETDIWEGQCNSMAVILGVHAYRHRWQRLTPSLGRHFVDFVESQILPRSEQPSSMQAQAEDSTQ